MAKKKKTLKKSKARTVRKDEKIDYDFPMDLKEMKKRRRKMMTMKET